MKYLLATLLAAPVFAFAGNPGAADAWTLETLQDKATYQTVAVLHQESSNTIGDEYAMKEVQPRLEFRCVPNTDPAIKVRIDWRRFISSFNTEVQFAADDKDPITVKLGVDRSNKITHTSDTADDAALIDYLSNQSSLKVTVTPYSEVPVSVNYVLEGLA
ncbi:MAG: hypothetical protein RIA65_11850, partial [Woeseia sp.]